MPTITDLTGTTWLITDSPSFWTAHYYINFTSNNQSFVAFVFDSEDYEYGYGIFYCNGGVYDAFDDRLYSWVNEAYRTILVFISATCMYRGLLLSFLINLWYSAEQ